jgi:hypothetical protein
MLYKWNQLDPQSASIFKWLITILCCSVTTAYFLRGHPYLALITGLFAGVLLGQTIPPRLSLRRLALTLAAVLALGGVLTVFHW